jgi:hypothetical protein
MLTSGCERVDAVTVASTEVLRVGTGADQAWSDSWAAAEARLQIPPGALVDAASAEVDLVLAGASDPFSTIDVELSGDATGVVRLDSSGTQVATFALDLPTECANGCEGAVRVLANHVGGGEPPRFDWSVNFRVAYVGIEDIPVPITEFDVEFLPVEPPPIGS